MLSSLRALFNLLQQQRPENLGVSKANPVLKTIFERRTIRNFKPDPIPEEILRLITDSARYAPSGVNLQTYSLLILRANEWVQKTKVQLPFGAPLNILLLGDFHKIRLAIDINIEAPMAEFSIALVNASLAAQNIVLAAHSLGLGTAILMDSPFGLSDSKKLVKDLDLPKHVFPICSILLGYPVGTLPPIPPRIDHEGVVFSSNYMKQEDLSPIIGSWWKQFEAAYMISRKKSLRKRLDEHYSPLFIKTENSLKETLFRNESDE